jgi:hypothetical protein
MSKYNWTRAKQQFRKVADKMWKDGALETPVCEVCGQEPTITGHHFYYKSSYPHLRYDLDNRISIGVSCHFICHHKDPKLIEDKIIEKRGDKWLADLKEKAYTKPKPSFQTISYYKQQIEKLK